MCSLKLEQEKQTESQLPCVVLMNSTQLSLHTSLFHQDKEITICKGGGGRNVGKVSIAGDNRGIISDAPNGS